MRRMRPLIALSLAGLMALSACGEDVAAKDESTAGSSGNGANNSAPAKDGGAITVRGCTPQNPLIPANTNETCGGNIMDAVTVRLVHYNPDSAKPELDIAKSIETKDNQNFTVRIKPGLKFSDGTEVKAHNFVDGWNWGAYGPNAQQNSYFFEPIEGYDALQCSDDSCSAKPKADKMTGLKVVDDQTFTIKTTEKVANLQVRLGYTAFAPLPDAFLKDARNDKWAKTSFGAGPFKIVDNTATQIVLERNENYAGSYKPHVDKVTFKIYNDAAPRLQRHRGQPARRHRPHPDRPAHQRPVEAGPAGSLGSAPLRHLPVGDGVQQGHPAQELRPHQGPVDGHRPRDHHQADLRRLP